MYRVDWPGVYVQVDADTKTDAIKQGLELLNEYDGENGIFFENSLLNGDVSPTSIEEMEDE